MKERKRFFKKIIPFKEKNKKTLYINLQSLAFSEKLN